MAFALNPAAQYGRRGPIAPYDLAVLIPTEFTTGVFTRFDLAAARQIRSALSAVKIAYLPNTEPLAVEAARLRTRRPARCYACRRAPVKNSARCTGCACRMRCMWRRRWRDGCW